MKPVINVNIKKVSLLLILAILFVGCDSILKEDPKSSLSNDKVFSSTQGAIAAVKGAYATLGHGYLSKYYYNWWFSGITVLPADYSNGAGSQASLGNFKWSSQDRQRIGFAWIAIYKSINRANNVVQNAPNVEGIEPNLEHQLIGEARFIRALGYFNLVRLWGDVPLKTKPTSNNEGLSTPRSPKDDVYKLIIEDLKYGEENLPDSYDKDDNGRATKWAAKTLLSKVYLTLERWNDAAAKAKEVIDSGEFSLVKVHSSEDFEKIYGPDVATNSEDIFSIKHNGNYPLGNNLPWLINVSSSPYTTVGYGAWYGNPDSWLGDWKANTPDLRRNHNLYNGADTVYLSASKPILFKKFKDPEGDFESSRNPFPIFRYPSDLLIYAEAVSQANDGPTSEAYKMVNKVRRRAYGEDPNGPDTKGADLTAGLSATAFRDSVLLERAKEFLLEDKRWFDLLRTHTALSTLKSLGKPIEEKHLKYPIPQEEMDNNDSLSQADQNPGW